MSHPPTRLCLCLSALLALAGCTALKNPNDRAADAGVDSGLDAGAC